MCDGQAQTGADLTGAPAGAAAFERHEDAFLVLRRDADARVFHFEAHHAVPAVHAKDDATSVGEAHRVGQQVDEYLA